MLALKISRNPGDEGLQRVINLLAELLRQGDTPGMIRTVLRYLWSVDNTVSLRDYVQRLEQHKQPELREEIMTIVEQLEHKGRQEGMQQGMQQGMQKGLLEGRRKEAASMLSRILHRRFGSIPEPMQAAIAAASLEDLENRVDKALDAQSIHDVFPS